MTQDYLLLTPEDAGLLLNIIADAPVITFLEQGARADLVNRIQAHARRAIPPLKGDKVWSGLTIGLVRMNTSQNQAETIVRAKSQAQAIRLLSSCKQPMSAHYFRNYWSDSKNREELRVANTHGVWAKGPDGEWIKFG